MLKRDLEILVDLQNEYIADLEEDLNVAITFGVNSNLYKTHILEGGVNFIEYPAPTLSYPDLEAPEIIIGILMVLAFIAIMVF